MSGKRQALIDRRKELGYSQTDMADLVGIDQSSYCGIEKGRSNPNIYRQHQPR